MTGPLAGAGVGIGWRPEIAGFVADLPGLRFTEVIAETVPEVATDLAPLRVRGVAVVPHGTRLSLGGAEPLDPVRVRAMARAAEMVDAPLVSEHIAFVRAGGVEAGHLLPLPRSREAVDVMVGHTAQLMAEVGRPVALEPIATLFDWPDDELTEAQFITEILDRTGAWLLIDLANVYANARNRGEDPADLLGELPWERVAYAHIAGGADRAGLYHDTHTDPVPADVLALLNDVTVIGHRPPVLLERDGHYPAAPVLRAELDAIAAAAGYPVIT